MPHHAAEPATATPAAPLTAAPAAPLTAAPAAHAAPVWRHGAALAAGTRAVLAAVDRLAAQAGAAGDAHRRDPDEQLLRGRLEDAVTDARTVAGDLIGQVERLEQYALSGQRWDLATRLAAVAAARTVDAMAVVRAAGEPTQAQVEAAARVERALAGLRPDAEDLEHGFEDLRGGLRRLQRALRDALTHRADRPLSLPHLRLLLDGTGRVLSTAAVGLLAALALATREGAGHGDAAVAAATAAAAPADGLVELVGRRLRAPAPEHRLLAAHDDLTYLVGDFATAAATAPDRDRLEDLYTAALAESAHAARWSQRVGWTAGHDYAVTARQVPVVLAAAMSAARADDAAGLTEATRAVRAVHESLSRYRIPESAVRAARPCTT
jgi:hypothetical protein